VQGVVDLAHLLVELVNCLELTQLELLAGPAFIFDSFLLHNLFLCNHFTQQNLELVQKSKLTGVLFGLAEVWQPSAKQRKGDLSNPCLLLTLCL
jgi:hypothetical protein